LLAALVTQQISKAEFVASKQSSDAQKQVENNQLCGYVNAQPDTHTKQLSYSQAKEMLSQGDVYLIDTREPYEHGANNLSALLNVSEDKTFNIPLSRMANAIVEGQLDKNNQYILVCRSGNRSKLAAANLIDLGYKSVFNLNGGLALSY
jgi:cysteine desulfurase